MVPGAQVWFAVRARDDRGQMSPINPGYARTRHLRLEPARGRAGRHRAPLLNVILDNGDGKVTTDAAGCAASARCDSGYP